MMNYELDKKYRRKGVDCFLDSYREIFIQATPEEIVRQQILKFLEYDLKVPTSMIATEMILKKYNVNSNKRIDIVIHETKEDGYMYPMAVIECKSNDVHLTDTVYDQACEYADLIGANYVFITNGMDILGVHYNKVKEQYETLKEIPLYNDMIENIIEIDYEDYQIDRVKFESLSNIGLLEEIDEFQMLGDDTPDKYKPFIFNIGECLLDTSKRMRTGNYGSFNLIQDYGIRYMSYGNASGGKYPGNYRTLIIEDSNGNNQMISFSILASVSGKSVLVVAIDDFDKSHNSLQLDLNKFINIIEHKVSITHNGAIAIGNIGSGKRAELKEFIKSNNINILNEKDDIVLGTISNDKLLYMDNPEVEVFIANLVEYALVRDLYRDYKKGCLNVCI